MNVLVTGATGFLGLHFLRAIKLVQPNARLIVLVRNKATWHEASHCQEHPDAHVIEAPLWDVAAVRASLVPLLPAQHPLHAIVHLGATVHHSRHQAKEQIDSNVQGTQGMVDLASIYRARLIFVSTSGTVGCHKNSGIRALEDAPFCEQVVGRWPYYVSKIRCERLIRAAVAKSGLQAVILRPPVMLGPEDHRFRATSLLVRYLQGKVPFYLQGGMHFIDIRDAAMSIARATLLPQPRQVYHLPGHMMPLKDYFAALQRVSGVPGPKRCLPGVLAKVISRLTFGKWFDPVVIEMGQHHWDLGGRHMDELNFHPRPEQQTLVDTLTWLRQAHPALQQTPR